MLTLKNWELRERIDGMVYVNGSVFGHYRLQDGDLIHTSVIMKIYRCSEQEYVFKTMSGSLYHLHTNEMNPQKADITNELMNILEVFEEKEMEQSLKLEDEIFAEKSLRRKKLISNLETIAKENMDEDGLYLLMEQMMVIKAVLKKGKCFRELQPSVHTGMFQDSVLITDWEKGEVDFRYYPNYLMEPYHWSDGLANIYIHNIGNYSIVFKGTEENIECKSDEVIKIGKDMYYGDGLFSSDVVNGKCVFSNTLSSDRNENKEHQKTITQEEINRLLKGLSVDDVK